MGRNPLWRTFKVAQADYINLQSAYHVAFLSQKERGRKALFVEDGMTIKTNLPIQEIKKWLRFCDVNGLPDFLTEPTRYVGPSTDLEIGDRVQMTRLGLEQGLDGKNHRRRGVIVEVFPPRDESFSIQVLRDGERSPDTWHHMYWTRERAKDEYIG